MTSAKRKTVQAGVPARTLVLTAVTMVLFAANSLLARFALGTGEIDAASFTAVRVGAGAAALALLASLRNGKAGGVRGHGSGRAAAALFVYAITFSFAYLLLNASAGALVMFACVQMTMFGLGMAGGEQPRTAEWSGLAVAFGGLVYLASPGVSAPSTAGVLLMAVSGISWGYYSFTARGDDLAVEATAGNFARAFPLAAAALLVAWWSGQPHASWRGIGAAGASGAIASGLGYALWYEASKGLRTSAAAVVQLTVPVLTATAGVMLLGEPLSWRIVLASAAILSGIALALAGKLKANQARDRA